MRDLGAFVAYNNDDDNENGVPDYLDPGDASADDLVRMTLDFLPAGLPLGLLELVVLGDMKVWSSEHKGATLFVILAPIRCVS